MNEDPQSQETEPVSDALRRKIKSEIAKNEAETRKLTLEAEEVQKRQSWYRGPLSVIVKWVVSVLVTSVLLATFVVYNFMPIYDRKLERDKLEYDIDVLKLGLEAEEVNARNAALNENLIKARGRTENLRAGFESLRNAYDSLANVKGLLVKERARYAELAKIAQKQVDSLTIEILQLRDSRRDIEVLGQALESKGGEEYLPQVDEKSYFSMDEFPVPIDSTGPTYPRLAIQAGIEGTVWVKVLVDTNGTVRDARIFKESGSSAGFEEATLQHAYTRRFTPATYNGKAVAVWIVYPMRFTLK